MPLASQLAFNIRLLQLLLGGRQCAEEAPWPEDVWSLVVYTALLRLPSKVPVLAK
jgi:hypothetical protein